MEVSEHDEAGKLIKKQTRSVPEGWGKKIVGRRVDFGDSEKGLAWGIEVELPFGDKERKLLKQAGIVIPERIDTIRYLDMTPQESLSEKERNIRSKINEDVELTNLNTFVGSTATPTILGPSLIFRDRVRKRLKRLFVEVLTHEKKNKELFNSEITNGKGKEILIVHGHGGGDPMTVGEQYNDEAVDKEGKIVQKKGNTVLVDEIIERYNKPDIFSAIMLHSCYVGKEGVAKKNVPVFYGEGLLSIARVALRKRELAVAEEKSQ